MPERLDLSIIIVNWKSAEFVRGCVRSIRRQTRGITYEVLVIDNASYDGCERMLRQEAPEVIYLQSEENHGFARANNVAFERARGASLLFLNPDTEILGAAIGRLHRALRELPAAGVVGPKLLNRDGSVQSTCVQAFPNILNQVLGCEYLERKLPHSSLWGMAAVHRSSRRPSEVEMVPGACLMISREVFERIGRFSEDYFMYTEDADLCYKARAGGWKTYYVPEAVVVHFGGGSSRLAVSDFSAVMMRESLWRFLRKTRGRLYGLAYRGSMLLSALCRLGLLGCLVAWEGTRRREKSWADSLRKWRAVLRWSLGLERFGRRNK
jgi:hypothetical protein